LWSNNNFRIVRYDPPCLILQSFLGDASTFNTTCCKTDKCNTIAVSGATATKMTFTAAIGGAILTSVLGSML
uniref:UPAR/Ly6 domain-containing protein n=1 Tax=Poecilia reticulata TaxID=8081 RepID=A0A3P9MZP1_POERE